MKTFYFIITLFIFSTSLAEAKNYSGEIQNRTQHNTILTHAYPQELGVIFPKEIAKGQNKTYDFSSYSYAALLLHFIDGQVSYRIQVPINNLPLNKRTLIC